MLDEAPFPYRYVLSLDYVFAGYHYRFLLALFCGQTVR